MGRFIRNARRGAFGLAVAGALGFGAAQAVAAPPTAERAVCNDRLCNRVCQTAGFIGGFCGSDGSCNCYL